MQKNKKKLLTDIVEKVSKPDIFSNTTKQEKPKLKEKKTRNRGWLYIILIILALFFTLYVSRGLFLKNLITQSAEQIYSQLESAKVALTNFDPASAEKPLKNIKIQLEDIENEANKFGFVTISKVWTSFTNKFKSLPNTFASLLGISDTAINLNDDIKFLKDNAISLMLNGEGEKFINKLESFQIKLLTLNKYINQIQEEREDFNRDLVVELKSQIDATENMLNALIITLAMPVDQHFLILFQNSTEQRPGGGFIGSFAHLTLNQGSLKNISVNDIYDPDGQLDLKIIPPQPLQQITKTWGARDANWFFDYPTSAQQIIDFLNNSKIYKEQDIKFSGAIAINVQVIEDLLKTIGTIELEEYDLVIDSENFLTEVQKEVEAGEDKTKGEPKKILKVLTPLVLERLSELNSAKKNEFQETLKNHFSKKDVMIYSTHNDIEGYLRSIGIAGEVYAQDFTEYLAVVNANIGGHKTDAFIEQNIILNSNIGLNGEITNDLKVIRTHNGENEREWWYRSTNKNYLQIYTPLNSDALDTVGRSLWPVDPGWNYQTYETDSDLAEINQTLVYLSELGLDQFVVKEKTVFSAWMNTKAGDSREFEILYRNPNRLEFSEEYTFVFEKQSGANTTLDFIIESPPGYKWVESDDITFSYSDDNPNSRIIIPLHLAPILVQSP